MYKLALPLLPLLSALPTSISECGAPYSSFNILLQRYYPVDYDPAKIPKLKGKQKEANRLWGIRVMAPFNMR